MKRPQGTNGGECARAQETQWAYSQPRQLIAFVPPATLLPLLLLAGAVAVAGLERPVRESWCETGCCFR